MKNWNYILPAMAAGGEQVLQKLNDHGYDAYFVGGCVRDELMQRTVTDMDITTSATPDQVITLFPDSIPTGLQHGTVTVRSGGHHYEVTTFRTESGYEDYRRPTEVHFVDRVEEDLKRRDFTMNAIARNVKGELLDPFHGQEDIKLGLVKCVGIAEDRFEEDALRIMRGVRFASVFNFDLDSDTWAGMLRQRDKLGYIAMERVRTEMDKMMAGPFPSKGVQLLMDSRLTEYVKSPISFITMDRKWVTYLDKLPQNAVYRYEMVLLLLQIRSTDANTLLREWTFSGETRDRITKMLAFHEEILASLEALNLQDQSNETNGHYSALRTNWISLVLHLGIEAAQDWLTINNQLLKEEGIFSSAYNEHCPLLLREADSWTKEMGVYQVKDLELGGADLLRETGRKGGPWLGRTMKILLHEVALGHIPNVHDDLLQAAKKVIEDEI
ncbi:CCA tRNA nucleotidyltransferase [Paenibacillus sp. Marseille-Q4541]|uniref:CCA tRNA nucleotidyltransferase n=1 Tax=Paenibacillus sp. Marseille-Q4541 TaxID=2831522 RepID=UPI001BADB33B|nr:CCA tRNA nucleotidyltransferase [Paenibacillus sp. Marseille-Q4541]